MNEREEKELVKVITPICGMLADSYLRALLLRCQVHALLAERNGAEPEDMPEVIAHAIESQQPIVQRFLDEVGELKKAEALKGEIK